MASTSASASTLSAISSSSKVVRPRPSTYAKFLSIDVCSPLGQYIYRLSNNKDEVIDISSLCMAERKSALRNYVETKRRDEVIRSKSIYFPNLFQSGHGEEYNVTFRVSQRSKEDPHLYCFNHRQMAVKKFTLHSFSKYKVNF